MKTTKQLFCRLLSVLIMLFIVYVPLRAQTVATPTLFTTIASGPQTVMAASLSGADHWFRWVGDTGLVKVDVKLPSSPLYLRIGVCFSNFMFLARSSFIHLKTLFMTGS